MDSRHEEPIFGSYEASTDPKTRVGGGLIGLQLWVSVGLIGLQFWVGGGLIGL